MPILSPYFFVALYAGLVATAVALARAAQRGDEIEERAVATDEREASRTLYPTTGRTVVGWTQADERVLALMYQGVDADEAVRRVYEDAA